MGAIEHLTIAVPAETVERMRDWVATGDFTDLNDVVLAALREFEAHDRLGPELGTGEELRAKIDKAYEGWRRDPGSAIPLKDVIAKLKAGGSSGA